MWATEGRGPLTACVFGLPANWEVVMIKERAWSIRSLTGRSFLPVIGSMVLTGTLTATAQPPASQAGHDYSGIRACDCDDIAGPPAGV